MSIMHSAARVTAYLIALLLALVWSAAGAVSLARPLFDIGLPHAGDTIVSIGRMLSLPPDGIVAFAHILAASKLFIGLYLFITIAVAAYDWVMQGSSDDAMLDVGLLMSGLASPFAAIPFVNVGGEPLQSVIGEIMLAVIASALAIYGRGFIAPVENPKPKRPEPVIVPAYNVR